MADQCFPDRRFVRNFSLQAVCLRGTDNTEIYLFIIFQILQRYLAADIDFAGIHLIFHNDFRVLQDFFNLFNSRLNVSLLILGSIIFRVLGQIALLSGDLDFFRNFTALIYFQVLQLILKLPKTRISKNVLLFFHNCSILQ